MASEQLTRQEAQQILGIDDAGFKDLVSRGRLRTHDRSIEDIVDRMQRKYPVLNGSLRQLMADAEEIFSALGGKTRKGFYSEEVHRVHDQMISLDEGYEIMFGFVPRENELQACAADLMRAIPQMNGVSGKVMTRNDALGLYKEWRDKPRYAEAVAALVTSHVLPSVITSLKKGSAIEEFKVEFGIGEEQLKRYIERGIVRTGGIDLLSAVLEEAHKRYPKVSLLEQQVRRAIGAQAEAEFLSISNYEEFSSRLIPIDDITREIYDGLEFAVGLAQMYATRQSQVGLVNHKGRISVPVEDKGVLALAVQRIPPEFIRRYLCDELECTESDIKAMASHFKALEPGFVLDRNGALQLKSDLEEFRKGLYDNMALAEALGVEETPVGFEKAAVNQLTNTTRLYDGMIHRDHAEQIVANLRKASSDLQKPLETLLSLWKQGYARFAPSKGFVIDTNTLKKQGVSREALREYGRAVYDAAQAQSIVMGGTEVVSPKAVKSIIESATDLTELGLYARVDLERYKERRHQIQVEYVCRLLDIRAHDSADRRDPNRYYNKGEADRVSAVWYAIMRSNPDVFSNLERPMNQQDIYLTPLQIRQLLQGREMPQGIPPVINAAIYCPVSDDDKSRTDDILDFQLFSYKALAQPLRDALKQFAQALPGRTEGEKVKLQKQLEAMTPLQILVSAAQTREKYHRTPAHTLIPLGRETKYDYLAQLARNNG